MLEQTKKISFRISSVLSKVEPEPDLHTGSDQKVPAQDPQHCIHVIIIIPYGILKQNFQLLLRYLRRLVNFYHEND